MNLPCISRFHKDCLFSVIPNSPYCQQVLIQLGTLHIDQALELATEKELENLDWKWKRGQIATLLSSKAAKVKLQNPIATFSSVVKLTKKIMIQPFETFMLLGYVQSHSWLKG